jgi:hypothetical protein
VLHALPGIDALLPDVWVPEGDTRWSKGDRTGTQDMNPLHQWVADWIPADLRAAALADLQQRLAPPAPVSDAKPMSEAAVSNTVRLAAAARGWHLWRNNNGAMQDKTGRVVRYGLANESKQMSAVVKSADLIGFTDSGRFVSIECKAPGARTDPDRLAAQERWRDLVLAAGGIACITDGELP